MFLILLFVPGLAVSASVGLRGWARWGAAPAVSFGLIGAVSPYLDGGWLAWNIGTLALSTVLLCAIVLALRIFVVGSRPAWKPTRPQITSSGALVALAVAVSAGVGAYVVWRASQRFQAFPQWWDTTFHANAIRFIADSGNADPSALRIINFPSLESFYYPSADHALSALVVRATGIPIEAVLNVGDAVSTGVFALGLAALVVVLGGEKLTAAAVALIACVPASALYDIMVWGPLFPYVLGTAVIPSFLVALASCLRTDGSASLRSITVALSGLGLVALHPGAAFAAAVLGVLLVAQLVVSRELQARSWGALAVAVVVLLVVGFPQLRGFLAGAGGASVDWPGTTPPAEAVGHLLLQDHVRDHPQWWLLILVLLGLWSVRRQRVLTFYLVGAVVFAGLYVAAASYEGPLVAEVTRPWWNDQYRLLALATHGLVLVAGFGLANIARTVTAGLGAVLNFFRAAADDRTGRLVRGLGVVVAFLVMSVATHLFYVSANVDRVRQLYGSGPTVTADKLAAYRELARLTPPGSVTMNDPADGSPWMWAYAGVRPVFGHALMIPTETPSLNDDQRALLYGFNQMETNPVVRSAIARMDVRYVIVANGFISDGLERAPGLQDLQAVPALTKVFENRDAVIYRVPQVSP
ncbi:DUF6541 family protein [Actinomycetospora sp. CA-084318]|uniref:DUF6541 family protein n=1 Tax=Actinomycetospora sp. CA-084318 TaxID=3239892 RepID=UPI003D965CEB